MTTPTWYRRLLKLTSPRMRGDDVKAVQGLLHFTATDTDGIYGRQTRQAVLDFQAANVPGIPDGKVGPVTAEALEIANMPAPPTSPPPPPPPPPPTSPPPTSPPPVAAFDPLTYDWSTVGGPVIGGIASGSTTSQKNIIGTTPGVTPIFGSSYSVLHSYATSLEDAADFIGNGPYLIEYSKLWRDGTNYGSAHHDGIQSWNGHNLTARRLWIEGWTTSAMLLKTDTGPISHVTLAESYLANKTGWWVLYVMDAGNGHGRPTFVDITDCKVSALGRTNAGVNQPRTGPIISTGDYANPATFCHTREQRQAAIDGGDAKAAEWIVWRNILWADGPNAGQPVPLPDGAVWH